MTNLLNSLAPTSVMSDNICYVNLKIHNVGRVK